MAHGPEILSSAVVVVGNFNPAIFSLDWLERNGLIGEADATMAREGITGKPLIISKQVSILETEWFSLQVFDNQFTRPSLPLA